MQALEFSYSPKLEDLSELSANFPQIKKFQFDHCKNIKDYTPLSKLENLQESVILESAPITYLSFLRDLKNLSLLKIGKTKILAGNLEILEGIPAKVNLFFTGVKQ